MSPLFCKIYSLTKPFHMKVTIYIEKNNFDNFYRWVRQLNIGVLSSPPVKFSNLQNVFKDPLRISLDTHEYYLITDAQEDLKKIEYIHGSFNVQYEPDTYETHLQRIKESVRNAQREGLDLELIYYALMVIKDLPDITPSEAVIIAEKSVLRS